MKADLIAIGGGVIIMIAGIICWITRPKPRKVPIHIRSVLQSLPADDATVYRDCVESLYQASMELAAEVGACPSCGSDPDTHMPPTKYPHVLRFSRGGGHNGRGISGPIFCGVCGVEAIEVTCQQARATK